MKYLFRLILLIPTIIVATSFLLLKILFNSNKLEGLCDHMFYLCEDLGDLD